MLELFQRPESWIAIATLSALEIVLGIDNLVFVAILAGRVPEAQRSAARKLGLAAALLTRLALLFSISWVMGLTRPLFTLFGFAASGQSLILVAGGLFLVAKSTREIYHKTEMGEDEADVHAGATAFWAVIAQIAVIDIVFSLDSIITAVGMVKELPLMVIAIVIAMAIMILSADAVSGFIDRHPSLKILALAFLLLIGVLLLAEGTGRHVEKGYIYFAMAFSLLVELVNMRYRANRERRRSRLKATREAAPQESGG
jgi:predicted tellurium resistance membrane protein TerC